MSLFYSVRFRAGRYKVAPMPQLNATTPAWQIGRDVDGHVIGFALTENDAAHICLALNLVDAYIGGNTGDQREILKALERFRH